MKLYKNNPTYRDLEFWLNILEYLEKHKIAFCFLSTGELISLEKANDEASALIPF